MIEAQTVRKAILRSIRKARKAGRITPATLSALKNRFFPFTFFVRNILTLQRESGWMRGSARVRKNRLFRMLKERGRIFLEVRRWILENQREQKGTGHVRSTPEEPSLTSGYCSHCGGCCEIASGFPDFPREVEIPSHWQRLFGDGLGAGHRFCAFLWEVDAKGRSRCAIHPWRSTPCRLFEEDECEYFMNDQEATALFDPKAFLVACHRLSHLINRG